MKVLIVVPAAERLGGAETLLLMLLRHAGAAQLDPLVCFLRPGQFEQELRDLGVATARTDAGRLRNAGRFAATVLWLARLIRAERPDVILDWMQKSHLYGAPAAVLSGMGDRLVWWQHDIPRRELLNVAATALPARGVGTISRSAALAQQRLRPRRRTFTIGAGIDPPRAPSDREVAALRAQLGIPPERFVVGIVARLQAWKGQHHVLRATAILRERGHDVHCLVTGGDADGREPRYASALRRLAADLGLGGAVTFTGQVADPAPYIRLSDVAVNASDAEPFGISILEAMALGVPAVAVDAAGPADILGHGRGLLVGRAEPAELANAIERLIADPALRARLASQGPDVVRSEFRADRGARELAAQLAAVRER